MIAEIAPIIVAKTTSHKKVKSKANEPLSTENNKKDKTANKAPTIIPLYKYLS